MLLYLCTLAVLVSYSARFNEREFREFTGQEAFEANIQKLINERGILSESVLMPDTSVYAELWNEMVDGNLGKFIGAALLDLYSLEVCARKTKLCERFKSKAVMEIANISEDYCDSRAGTEACRSFFGFDWNSLNKLDMNDFTAVISSNNYELLHAMEPSGDTLVEEIITSQDGPVKTERMTWITGLPQLNLGSDMNPHVTIEKCMMESLEFTERILVRAVFQNQNNLNSLLRKVDARGTVVEYAAYIDLRDPFVGMAKALVGKQQLDQSLIDRLYELATEKDYFEWVMACENNADCKPFSRPSDLTTLDEHEDFECPLCLNEIKKGCIQTKCGHRICKPCIERLYEAENKKPCPMCRQPNRRGTI